MSEKKGLMTLVGVSVTAEDRAAMLRLAADSDRTLSNWVLRLIRKEIRKQKEPTQ